jgi:hypothetical protein
LLKLAGVRTGQSGRRSRFKRRTFLTKSETTVGPLAERGSSLKLDAARLWFDVTDVVIVDIGGGEALDRSGRRPSGKIAAVAAD